MRTNYITFIALIMATITTVGCASNPRNENIGTYKLGNAEINLLSEGQHDGSIEIILEATPQMLETYAPADIFPMAVNGYMIRMPGVTALIDAGYGFEISNNMRSLGVEPAEVDAIFVTHMHNDHIGGMLEGDRALFANAQVYVSQPEYDYWMSDMEMEEAPEETLELFRIARTFVAAYGDRVHTFHSKEIGELGEELIPGITPIAAYGHTPGHTMYMMESGVEKMLFWGDITHAMVIQMPHPEIAVTYDIAPQQAIVTRAKVLEFVAENEIREAGGHIPKPSVGMIFKGEHGSGYIFSPEKSR